MRPEDTKGYKTKLGKFEASLPFIKFIILYVILQKYLAPHS